MVPTTAEAAEQKAARRVSGGSAFILCRGFGEHLRGRSTAELRKRDVMTTLGGGGGSVVVVVGVADVAADSVVSNFTEITRNSRQAAGEERGGGGVRRESEPPPSLATVSVIARCLFFLFF